MDYQRILLQLIASITLSDHMGDVSNDVNAALEKIGEPIEWDEWSDLRRELGKRGVTTLYGTKIGEDDE